MERNAPKRVDIFALAQRHRGFWHDNDEHVEYSFCLGSILCIPKTEIFASMNIVRLPHSAKIVARRVRGLARQHSNNNEQQIRTAMISFCL